MTGAKRAGLTLNLHEDPRYAVFFEADSRWNSVYGRPMQREDRMGEMSETTAGNPTPQLRCQNCQFYVQKTWKSEHLHKDGTRTTTEHKNSGECRRYPPTLASRKACPDHADFWLKVMESDWCGEWRTKE